MSEFINGSVVSQENPISVYVVSEQLKSGSISQPALSFIGDSFHQK